MLAVLYAGALVRVARGVATRQTLAFAVFAPPAVLLLALVVALTPAAADALQSFVDVTLLQKSTSQSGIERQQWNLTAVQNFLDTRGLGGGLGSIRASSFPLAVLSNTGIVGAVCLGLFLLRADGTAASRGRGPAPGRDALAPGLRRGALQGQQATDGAFGGRVRGRVGTSHP